jgi:hypothetical protein
MALALAFSLSSSESPSALVDIAAWNREKTNPTILGYWVIWKSLYSPSLGGTKIVCGVLQKKKERRGAI